ncbi:glutaminyl-peptide cyclotransferase [Carboxylicivirga marina]|uniref:glutaminyl-peptide cyclotransferase n=1 Tax=Carboxylicivirga marina TaxID=2800988 RepID=UPI0025962C8D|nr:glutaminyl-peptide cyclotransferase [uncultured Carboxylicivirga sp.]
MKNLLIVLCVLICASCGIYLEYPPNGNNPQWRIIAYDDTAVYRLPSKMHILDSVKNLQSGKVQIVQDSLEFKISGRRLSPGINELDLVFYSEGKKRRSYERLYMVSDLEPLQYKVDNYSLLKHDENAFTQGLVWHNDLMYESTGLVGHSSLRMLNPKTGDIIKKAQLNPEIFAEGIAFLNDSLHVLTWKDELRYVFSEDLEQIKRYSFKQEGWGITADNDGFVASDGTNKLYYLSETFEVDSIKEVFSHRGPVAYINELEYINGQVWANVLGSDKIIVVEPKDGKVMMEIDVSECIDRHQYPDAGVLNGIAFDADKNKVYLTGKNWPYIIVWRPMFFDKSN